MKKAFILLAVLACAAPSILAQPSNDPAKMLQIFSAPIKTAGGDFTVTVLNDRTIDPLFGTSPSRFAIRTRARMATILFIQGMATKDFDFKPEVTVTQKGETLTGQASSVKNFTAGKIPKGQMIQGLVEFPKKLNLYEPFNVMMGGQTAEFRLNAEDVTDYGNK
jgi:hypothetical protein